MKVFKAWIKAMLSSFIMLIFFHIIEPIIGKDIDFVTGWMTGIIFYLVLDYYSNKNKTK